jgi:hypothetical protein
MLLILPAILCVTARLMAQQSADFILPAEPVYTPFVKTIFYKLGENTFPVKLQQYGNRTDLVFINMHDDEATSVVAAKKILEKEGGLLIEIENNLRRNIRFRTGNYYYSVDPNRIFSMEGIKKSMREEGRSSERAALLIDNFAKRIIELMPEEIVCVIALHNNSHGNFSAVSYTPGNKRAANASRFYIDSLQDADDFFLTTDEDLFERLSSQGYNAVLQDNENCVEDGSLSVYCGKRNIRYVNCETEHGKLEQYYEMIKAIFAAFPVPQQ